MITRALIENFRLLYEENNDRLNDWSSKLLEELDPFDWVQLVSERSYVVREIFAENEELLDELWERTPGDLEEREAELLYDLIVGMYSDDHHDFAIMTWVGEKILPFFEELGDAEMLVSLYHVMGEEYAMFYRLVRDWRGIKTAIDYYKKAIALKDRYAEIYTPEVRRYLFEDYNSLLKLLDAGNAAQCADMLNLYEEAHAFRISGELQGADEEETAEIDRLLVRMDEEILSVIEHRELLPAERQETVDVLLAQIEDRLTLSGGEETDSGFRTFHLVRWMQGEIGAEELLGLLIPYLNEKIPEPDYASTHTAGTMRNITEMLGYATAIVEVLGKMDISDAKKRAYVRQFLPKVMDVMNGIPYLFRTDTMHALCAEWFTIIEPFIQGEQAKIHLLMRMIIRRQPITYIHSMMVGEIAVLYAEEVFEKCPEEFVGVRGCKTAEEVLARRGELTEYIRSCGRLHDVGKCYIADIVNRQNRSLTDPEFDLIRKHPELGLEAVNHTKVLEPYFDVILGHHKHYDGKHGYPYKFDNTASPVRFVIDLITIADATDAATDVLGRNYQAGKEYSKVLEEFREGAGQRYNPRIVAMIDANPELQARIAELTTDGRYQIYYRSYQDIVKNGEE